MNFNKVKLSEICEMQPGFAFKSGDFGDFPSKVIKITNITPPFVDIKNCVGVNLDSYDKKNLKRYIAQKNDFILAMTGACIGKIARIQEGEAYINQRVLLFKPLPNVDKNFLYYALIHKPFHEYILNHVDSQTAQQNISDRAVGEYVLCLPELNHQKFIGNFLAQIDQKIFLNQKISSLLEEQLKFLYDYWFVQFDFPDAHGKPYQASGGKMIWNEQLKRNIPEGWEVQSLLRNRLSSIIKLGVDRFESKTYLATADVKGTTISNGTQIDYETRESRANMQPTENSVWFAKMKNSVKHLCLNHEMASFIASTILSTGFYGLQCTEISFEYISSFIKHSHFESVKDTLAHGVTQQAVNNGDLANIALIVPTEDIISFYHKSTKNIYAQMSKNICENKVLAQIRDWLLPLLMSGQARVED